MLVSGWILAFRVGSSRVFWWFRLVRCFGVGLCGRVMAMGLVVCLPGLGLRGVGII